MNKVEYSIVIVVLAFLFVVGCIISYDAPVNSMHFDVACKAFTGTGRGYIVRHVFTSTELFCEDGQRICLTLRGDHICNP